MIKLNLLPQKVRDGERLQLVIIVGVIVYAAGIMLLAWRWGAAKHRVSLMDDEIAEVQRQLDAPELKEAVQAVDRFTKDEKEKSDKASVVNALRKKQVTLLRLLDSMPDWMMDGQVWIQNLEVTVNGADRRVVMDGEAISPLAFAHFYTNLENQPIVKKIAVEAAPVLKPDMGKSVLSFKISFALEEFQ